VNESASASSGLLIPLFFNASLDSSNIPTNNTGAYDAAAADARRKAEQRELKNKRNRAGQTQTVGAGLNGVNDVLG
jgi:hypothetical protein